LLSSFSLRITSCFLLICIGLGILFPCIAAAGSFGDALNEGTALGTGTMTDFTPGKVTLPDTVPKYDEAIANKGNYTGYYTNPSGMGGVPVSEEAQAVRNAYDQRQKFNLSDDATFGNKCLALGADGKCQQWSLSKDLITNTYPDCEKVVIPEYETSETKTCTETAYVNSIPECVIKNRYVATEVEDVDGPCESISIPVHDNQVYATCKDNVELYRINLGQVQNAGGVPWAALRAAMCAVIGGCTYCWGQCPTGFSVSNEGELPPNSVYLGQGIDGISTWGDSGSRMGRGTWAKFYAVTKPSTIERVFLRSDSTCNMDDVQRWLQECEVTDYAKCNSSCAGCTWLMQDSEETSNTYPTTCEPTPCRAPTCEDHASALTPGYTICPPGDNSATATINDTLSTPTPLTDAFTTYENWMPITWQTVNGGPGIREGFDVWCSRIKFSCKVDTNNCQTLIDEGCVHYSSQCLDTPCTRYEHTYTCGTDRTTKYTVAYNCSGEIRCIGTDCADASYDANLNLGKALAAGEILNMARVDSMPDGGDLRIFPGKEMTCQASPEDCCKPTTIGLAIGDYVSMAASMYSMYRYASLGVEGVAASYASNITAGANYLATTLGYGTATTVGMEAGATCITQTTVTSAFGTTTMTTTMTGAGQAVGTTVIAPSAAISAIGTVVSVVGVLYLAYSIGKMVYDSTFACTEEDMETSLKLGFKLCHFVDVKKEEKLLFFTKATNRYCCFNSILARIIQEQGRPQLQMGWGGGNSPPICRGFTVQELASLDFSQMDLTEYTQYITSKVDLTPEEIENISNSVKAKFE